jgi:hypothetical protein
MPYGYELAAMVGSPFLAKFLHFCGKKTIFDGLTKPNFLAMPNYAYDLT